jgi:hypothetical protein
VLDALVAEISLQSSRIDAVVSKLEAAGVPEHMSVSLDFQASSLGSPFNHPGKTNPG